MPVSDVSPATSVGLPGPQFGDFARRGGATLYGMTKAALDHFSVGLAAEVWDDGVAVNSLAPVAAVRTPGVEALGMLPAGQPDVVEPMDMVEAALALCTRAITGRVALGGPLLVELGIAPRTLDGRTAFEAPR